MSEIDKLYELQDKILTSLSDFLNSGNKFPFFLTGGTALVRFHLKITYRISYDLDFFSYEKITKEEVENIISFLFKKFNVSFKAENEEEKIFICELREGDLSVKVDFVEDPFLQVFEPEKLEETNLLIDSIQAIYFRKIYALIDLYIRGRPVDRIKDILDLMELTKKFLPLPDFVRKFVEIWRQNFETKIQAGLIAEALRDIFLVLPYHKQEIESALKRIYYSSIGYEEIEEWVRTQITLLKGMI
jgi:predicted nucleotidyltransferase component of viral defense system